MKIKHIVYIALTNAILLPIASMCAKNEVPVPKSSAALQKYRNEFVNLVKKTRENLKNGILPGQQDLEKMNSLYRYKPAKFDTSDSIGIIAKNYNKLKEAAAKGQNIKNAVKALGVADNYIDDIEEIILRAYNDKALEGLKEPSKEELRKKAIEKFEKELKERELKTAEESKKINDAVFKNSFGTTKEELLNKLFIPANLKQNYIDLLTKISNDIMEGKKIFYGIDWEKVEKEIKKQEATGAAQQELSTEEKKAVIKKLYPEEKLLVLQKMARNQLANIVIEKYLENDIAPELFKDIAKFKKAKDPKFAKELKEKELILNELILGYRKTLLSALKSDSNKPEVQARIEKLKAEVKELEEKVKSEEKMSTFNPKFKTELRNKKEALSKALRFASKGFNPEKIDFLLSEPQDLERYIMNIEKNAKFRKDMEILAKSADEKLKKATQKIAEIFSETKKQIKEGTLSLENKQKLISGSLFNQSEIEIVKNKVKELIANMNKDLKKLLEYIAIRKIKLAIYQAQDPKKAKIDPRLIGDSKLTYEELQKLTQEIIKAREKKDLESEAELELLKKELERKKEVIELESLLSKPDMKPETLELQRILSLPDKAD